MMKAGSESPSKPRRGTARLGSVVLPIALLAAGLAPDRAAMAQSMNLAKPARYYLPGPQASKIVTVTSEGSASAEVTVMTEAVAVKESGPQATVAQFGEAYAFSPPLIALHRGEPTMITFWHLQSHVKDEIALLGNDIPVL